VNRWYIDSNVLGAYYCPEPLSPVAQSFLLGVDEPVISLLTEVEVFSVVAKKKRSGDFGESKARKVLLEFQSHLEAGHYRKIIPVLEHYLRAKEMIAGFATSLLTLDALHIAMAVSDSLPIVTADKVLARAAEHFGVKVDLLRADGS
jgi:uncharacterized protein